MLYYAIVLFAILVGLYFYIEDKGTEHDYEHDYVMWALLAGLVCFLLYFIYKTNILATVMGKSKLSPCQARPHHPYANAEEMFAY